MQYEYIVLLCIFAVLASIALIIYKALSIMHNKVHLTKSKLFGYALILSVVYFLLHIIDGSEIFLSFLTSISFCIFAFIALLLLSPLCPKHVELSIRIIVFFGLLFLQLIPHYKAYQIPKLAYIEADSPLVESIENHLKFEFPDKVESDITLIYQHGHDGSSSFGPVEGYEISFELTPESFVEFENKFKGEHRHYETVVLENNNILVSMNTRPYLYPSLDEVPDRSVGRTIIYPASEKLIPREQIQEEATAWEYLKHNVLN